MKIKLKRKSNFRKTEKPRKRVIQKHYGRLIGATLFSWILIGLMIFKVDPENIKNLIIPNSYLLFMLLLLAGFFFLLSIILMSSKRSLLWSVLIVTFIYLRIMGIGGLINGLLLLSMGLTFDIYRKLKS